LYFCFYNIYYFSIEVKDILLSLGIANEGFTRIVIQEGEIKKEFDNMLMILNQEHEAMELKNLEIAKILQVSGQL